MCFVANGWKTARFNVTYDGYENNAHCTVYAIKALVNSYCYLTEPDRAAREIPRMYEEFVQFCCYTLQHMHTEFHEHKDAKFMTNSVSISHMMIFLEQFVALSDGKLNMITLEKYFPYTILRTNYIEIYQNLENAFETVDGEDEEGGEKTAVDN